jgi:hypothetical protein
MIESYGNGFSTLYRYRTIDTSRANMILGVNKFYAASGCSGGTCTVVLSEV